MTMLVRLTAFVALAVASSLAWFALSAPADAGVTRVRMVLNWKYQGPQGMFFLAQDRGHFAAEGLDVVIDQGSGSSAAVPLVANGTYDIGFGDINALIEYAARHPGESPIAVYMMFNQPPFAIAVRADGPIGQPSDLVGRRIGGAANDGARKLFPAFCGIAQIDCSSISVTSFQPQLREQMLMQGQVDAVFGYVNTIRFSARLIGVGDERIRYLRYDDHGLDLYSNALIVSRRLVDEHPDAVAGFVRALNRGMIDALADVDAAVAAVARREPLLDVAIERDRFVATLHEEMNHPEIATIGLGNVDAGRLARSIDVLVRAGSLPRTPAVDEVFTGRFLPASDLPKALF